MTVALLVALLGSALAGTFGSGVAAADTTPTDFPATESLSSDQAQANQLATEIAAGAVRVHQLTEQYDQAGLVEAAASQRLQAEQAQLLATKHQASVNLRTLQRQAVALYSGSEPAATMAVGSTSPAIGQEYLHLAIGTVADTLDRLHLDQAQMHDQEVFLITDQRLSEAAVAAAAGLRQAALAQAAQEQSALSTVQGRLAQLVALQEAARVAQEQSLANERAANQSVAAREAENQLDSPAPSAVTPTQGLPVNNGLVQAVVGNLAVPAAMTPNATPTSDSATTTDTTPGAAVTTNTTNNSATPSSPPAQSGGALESLRSCESGGNYAENSGNGYYGAYQFSQETWTNLGFSGRPDQASPSDQDLAAQKLAATSGWNQWPACSAALGLS